MGKNWTNINWKDKNDRISSNFRVHEALWLPSWRIYHSPSDEEKQNIVKIAFAMEKIRKLVDSPIVVHCWIRPLSVNCKGSTRHNKNYNRAIGSKSRKSAHIFGRAVDFHCKGYTGPQKCAEVRNIIRPNLENWGIRMENKKGGWIHIDNYPVKNKRFFRP